MNNELKERLRFCSTLPTLPTIALKIIELANDPDADIGKACHFISHDPALAVKILKVANSPLYRSRRKAENIRQAVSILGTHAVTIIALSFTLSDSLIKQKNQFEANFDSNAFWRRSTASALACSALGEKKGLTISDDLFLAGLLQDIGILAFITMIPEEYGLIYSSASDHDALIQAERDTFGMGHDELGYALLKKWNIPDYISVACIASHSQPTPKESGASISACVAVSHYAADYFLNHKDTDLADKLTKKAQLWLNLDNDEISDVIEIMTTGLASVKDLFEIEIHHKSDIAGILSEAKELLTIKTLSREKELVDKSQHDGLTGAHNRGYFDETFSREFYLSKQHKLPLTLAMIDLDHFKKINDTYGHTVGDALLIMAVRAMLVEIRQDDTLCRYGGEEFALILPNTTTEEAKKLLLRLKHSISKSEYQLDNKELVSVTASIGIATNFNKGVPFTAPVNLIKAADLALYGAKKAGRDKVVEWSELFKK